MWDTYLSPCSLVPRKSRDSHNEFIDSNSLPEKRLLAAMLTQAYYDVYSFLELPISLTRYTRAKAAKNWVYTGAIGSVNAEPWSFLWCCDHVVAKPGMELAIAASVRQSVGFNLELIRKEVCSSPLTVSRDLLERARHR